MSRAKEIAAIMATYEPGQQWQVRYCNKTDWVDCTAEPGWDWLSFYYRRKPEPPAPKYRPWTPEEGIGKVVRHKADSGSLYVIGWFEEGRFFVKEGAVSYPPTSILDFFTQLDGSPCGVLETPTTN